MKFVPIEPTAGHFEILYNLLQERTPDQSISHKKMPTRDEHITFILKNPYREWFLLNNKDKIVGSIYLTKQNEIGVFIFEKYRGKGHGTLAVSMMMRRHPGERLLANINPKNEASIKCFAQLGFKLIQQTYAYEEQT